MMDANTLYAAASVGKQAASDEQIIKEVWSEEHSNMTAEESVDNCDAAYEKQGAEAYNKCYQASLGCKDADCNILAKKYAKALSKGYSGSFEEFKKKSANMSALGDLGKTIFGGLLANLANKKRNNGKGADDTVYPQEKSKTGLYIGLGFVALVAIGTTIYFATRKK